jgi:hypothetical protein
MNNKKIKKVFEIDGIKILAYTYEDAYVEYIGLTLNIKNELLQ